MALQGAVDLTIERVEDRLSPYGLAAGLQGWPAKIVSVVIGFVVWEVVGRLVPPLILAPFSATLVATWELALSGRLARDLTISGLEFSIGLAVGMTVGLLGALGWYVSRVFREFTDSWITVLYTTPSVALAPLFVIWLGLGIESKVALVVEAVFIPVWLSAYAGLVSTDQQLKEVARAFGARPVDIVRYVILPWALPSLIAGFRLALSRGMIAVVVGELIGATAGIGVLIHDSAMTFNTPRLLAGVLVLVVIALTIIELVKWLQARLLPWWAERI